MAELFDAIAALIFYGSLVMIAGIALWQLAGLAIAARRWLEGHPTLRRTGFYGIGSMLSAMGLNAAQTWRDVAAVALVVIMLVWCAANDLRQARKAKDEAPHLPQGQRER